MTVKMMILGFLTPFIVYAGITFLHLIIPARKLKGYVKHETTGELLRYRLNGIVVLITSVFIWFFLGRFKIVPFDWLYQVRWSCLAGAVFIGLLYSFIMVLKVPSTGKPFMADFWFGRIINPQFKDGVIDAKMWLYLIGAVMLQLVTLSFVAHHWQTYYGTGDFNPGIILGAAMSTWFCFEYLIFERVHLYTYDIFAERVGFKLGFGCLSFYPYFYAISLWITVNAKNPNHPSLLIFVFALLFLIGWLLTRGANLQKFYFKIAPEKKFICMKPEVVTDGKRSLLVSGYWGVSRHINYLGEIIQACAVAAVAFVYGASVGYPAILGV
ncbi:MAG: ERG4/ERG24 family protein, partial [Treponema sp.]|nr:ERG4/ERG24 family protein [Treponema sp.]